MAKKLLNHQLGVQSVAAGGSATKRIMRTTAISTTNSRVSERAYALPEVLICIGIMVLIYGSAIMAYIQTDRRAEWSAYSLEAQALSIRQLEQARAAKWETQAGVYLDQTISLYNTWTNILDLPYSGTNYVYATNYTTVTTETNTSVANNKSFFHMYRVDTVWMWRGRLFTNTTASFRAPN